METLLQDAYIVLPPVRRLGYRGWFLKTALGGGHMVADTIAPRKTAVYARVNHGRWIADCPDCEGSECITADDPVFMCLSCGNKDVRGSLRPVLWPDADERSKLERILVLRRDIKTRNWTYDETVHKMMRENKDNHMEVPEGLDDYKLPSGKPWLTGKV